MHELATLVNLMNIAEKAARENGAAKIRRLTLDVGAMTGIEPRYLQYYFPQASAGTMMEGAELVVNEIPVVITCRDCGIDYTPSKENDRRCPVCGSAAGAIVSGRELAVASIEAG